MSDSAPKLERYVPKPGEPALPPQLAEFQNKTPEEVLAELNRMPFFMNSLPGDGNDDSDINFDALEALKAMNYEGDPTEMLTNFKNQGNEQFKLRNYKDARKFYEDGLQIDAEAYDPEKDNKAACELELKNYRKCINDCKKSLKIDSKNAKAYYRMGKAFFLLKKYDEANGSISFGLLIDKDNKSLLQLLKSVNTKEEEILADEMKKLAIEKEKQRKIDLLEACLDIRMIENINSKEKNEFFELSKIHLEEKDVVDSQLIMPCLVLYPTIDELDFVAEVGELSTGQDIIDQLTQRPQEFYLENPQYMCLDPNNNGKKLHIYMETKEGGLVKINKKWTINQIFQNETPKIPMLDHSLRIYLAPKDDTEWIKKWDKNECLEKRVL
ncbi:TPR-like protein [Hanseniaspora valbyensis NRRL Y-1626]|uniref:TPR-like protein n=1 Tax=Hanseniaspora valbyensis NRRL Y-1626 TaxID=766949 RepID=A0A1B7T9M6_9ASCO|nr:TPR-like protein [Hanseniaspora valbyensis NRRL Y-1626]